MEAWIWVSYFNFILHTGFRDEPLLSTVLAECQRLTYFRRVEIAGFRGLFALRPPCGATGMEQDIVGIESWRSLGKAFAHVYILLPCK